MRKHSMRIMGNGAVPEASYDTVSIMGEANFYGGDAEKVRIMGKATIHDRFRVHRKLSIMGELTSLAAIIANEVHISGIASFTHLDAQILHIANSQVNIGRDEIPKITGELYVKTFTQKGRCQLEDVHAQKLLVYGLMKVEGKLICDNAVIRGALQVQELEAEQVLLYPNAQTYIEEIHATQVIISENITLFNKESIHRTWFGLQINEQFQIREDFGPLFVEVIEADDVTACYLNAKSVCAQTVVIGPHCQIERVEYTKSCQVHETSKVIELVDVSKQGGKEP